jgi:hypothetical protein
VEAKFTGWPVAGRAVRTTNDARGGATTDTRCVDVALSARLLVTVKVTV